MASQSIIKLDQRSIGLGDHTHSVTIGANGTALNLAGCNLANLSLTVPAGLGGCGSGS